MKILFILFCLLSFNLFAEDIIMRDGKIYKNVNIIERNDSTIVFLLGNIRQEIKKSEVGYMAKVPYNPVKLSSIETFPKENKKEVQRVLKTTRPYLAFLLVTVLSGSLAYQNFSEASDIGNTINDFNKIGIPTANLEKHRMRKQTIAVVYCITGLVSAIVSLHKIEVKPDGTSLLLTYNF